MNHPLDREKSLFNNDDLSSFAAISLQRVTGDRTSFSLNLSNLLASVDNISGPELDIGTVNFPTPVILETATSLALIVRFNGGDQYVGAGTAGGPGIGRDINGSNNPNFPPAGIERRNRNSYVTVDAQNAFPIGSADDGLPINLIMNLVAHQLAPPNINITTLTYDFGNVLVGDSEDGYLTISNTGGGVLNIQSLATTNPEFMSVSPATPFTIAPGSSQAVTVRFTPNIEGGASTTLIVNSDDHDEGIINISLMGNGTTGPCTPPPTDIVSWWPAEGNADDIQGTKHGVLEDGALTVNGKVGQTFKFDGQNDYVSTNLDIRPQALPQMTWEAWIFSTRINFGGRQAIFSIDDSEHDRSLIIQQGSDEFGVYTGGGIWHPTTIDVNQWQHIAVVYTTTDIIFYKNGTAFSRGIAEGYQTSTSRMSIGGNPVFNEFFRGNIDEVTVYNRALSAGEIQAIINAGSAGKCKPGEVVLDPDINVTQNTLAFGGVVVGQNTDLNLAVQNTGDGVLTVTGLTSSNSRFTAINPNTPFTVNSGNTQNVTVRFSPTVAGNQTGTLTIASNDPDEPAVIVNLTGNGLVPDIALSLAQLNFGNVTTGQTGTSNFTISNNGDALLNVTSIVSNEAQYILSQTGPITIPTGGSQAVSVTFAPTVEGAIGGTVTINSNDPDEPAVTVALTGNGVNLVPDIQVTPTTVNFGNVTVGQTGTNDIIIQNQGEAALNVTSIVSNNTQYTASPVGPFTLAVGGSQTVSLAFNPTQEGTIAGTVTISSNDPDEPAVTVALTGNGVNLVPDIQVTPTTVNFGNVTVGQTGTNDIIIQNQGEAALNVTSIVSNQSQYTVSPTGSFSLLVGGSQTVSIAFNPTQQGPIAGTVTISSNDPDESAVQVNLTGNGVVQSTDLTVWPGDLNNDGAVDQADVLPIGLYWLSTGPQRPDASLNWQGQLCPPWASNQKTYADANGDGTVDQADLLPVGFNWNKIHGTTLASQPSHLSHAPHATWNMQFASMGDEQIEVWIEGEDAVNLFGVSFEIKGTSSGSIRMKKFEIGSWLGDDVVHFSQINEEGGSISIGIVRKAGQSGVYGRGEVARVSFVLKGNSGINPSLIIQNVKAIDPSGRIIILPLSIQQIQTDVDDEGDQPTSFLLEQNSPNPFNPSTIISYNLPMTAASHPVRLDLFNTRGEKIITLVDKEQGPGRYQVQWNGKDNSGHSVAGGIYLCRLKAGRFISVKKMALAR